MEPQFLEILRSLGGAVVLNERVALHHDGSGARHDWSRLLLAQNFVRQRCQIVDTLSLVLRTQIEGFDFGLHHALCLLKLTIGEELFTTVTVLFLF